jgi:four helix bundle protein
MKTARRFEDLEAWRAARRLAVELYRVSGRGPFARDFPLRDQVRRAAISVMSNIAEGFERRSRREFLRFLTIAKASAGEIESQAYLAFDLGYLCQAELDPLRAQLALTKRLVVGLIRYLEKSLADPLRKK